MITLKDALQVIAAAESKARKIGRPMNIAVVDTENIQEKCSDAHH
jgi:uncharacterized protein GlcG (DUF336 family)